MPPPPLTLTEATPMQTPPQLIFVCVGTTTIDDGCVIVVPVVTVQLFTSVIVALMGIAPSPVTPAVPPEAIATEPPGLKVTV